MLNIPAEVRRCQNRFSSLFYPLARRRGVLIFKEVNYMNKISKARQQKELVVEEIKAILKESISIVLVDYRGITVEEANRLRRQLTEAGVGYKVFKNTLIDIAAKEVGIVNLSPYLAGLTALAYSPKDPVAPAKIMNETIKKLNKMQIKSGILEGKVIDEQKVKTLADLPSKQELVAKLLGSMIAPVVNLVSVLNGPQRALVYALSSIKDSKEAANG